MHTLNLWGALLIIVIHAALEYNLKVPWRLWATGKVVMIIAGYSFLWHKASYLCKWRWAVGLSLSCSRGPLIYFFFFFFCVCQLVLQALTALKPAPSEPIGTAKSIWRAGESQSRPGVRALSFRLLGKYQIWGRGKWKQSHVLVPLSTATGTLWLLYNPSPK